MLCKKKIIYRSRKPVICIKSSNYDRFKKAKELATKTNDVEFLLYLNNITENSLQLIYHKPCLTKYLRKWQRKQDDKRTEWHEKRDFNAVAYNKICIFIRDRLVIQKNNISMSLVRKMYAVHLKELYKEQNIDPVIFDLRHIEKK